VGNKIKMNKIKNILNRFQQRSKLSFEYSKLSFGSFKKIDYKYYIGIFVIGILIVGGIIFILRAPESAEAQWWNDTWSYRQTISITNTNTAQTDTQVKILSGEDLSALVTAGKIQADLDDLRFTDINGHLLKYWIEDSTGSSVDVWAFLPSVSADGVTVYMYYGNTSIEAGKSTVGTSDYPGVSCKAILLSGATSDGTYYIDPTAQESTDKFQTECDLDNNGGGWTLAQYSTHGNLTNRFVKSNVADYGTAKVLNLSSANETMFTCKTDGIRASWYYVLDQSVLDIIDGDNTDDNVGPLTVYNSDGHTNAYIQEDATDEFIIGRTTWSAQTWGAVDGYSSVRGPAKCEEHPVGTSISYDGTSLEGKYIYEIWLRESIISTTGHTVTAISPASEENAPGPIGYWNFDEGYGTTAYDSTGYKNDGTISGATWVQNGKKGGALSFDGIDDYVAIDPIIMDLSENYSDQ